MSAMLPLIALALTQRATTYGSANEMKCGDVGKPVSCSHGAVTASGEIFQPHTQITAAVPAPTNQRMRVTHVTVRVGDGPCVRVKINDKSHARWVGNRGLDLSPAAVRALTGSAPKHWSGELQECEGEGSG
jgi:rare lipoprotein A (peptidoglycan hydrolase)